IDEPGFGEIAFAANDPGLFRTWFQRSDEARDSVARLIDALGFDDLRLDDEGILAVQIDRSVPGLDQASAMLPPLRTLADSAEQAGPAPPRRARPRTRGASGCPRSKRSA